MFTQIASAMAPGGNAASNAGQAGFGFLVPMVLVILIFYFLIIRPQQKERKAHEQLLDSLKSGDKVITSGGLLGTVHSVTEKTVQLKLGDKMKVKILRSAIRGFQGESFENE